MAVPAKINKSEISAATLSAWLKVINLTASTEDARIELGSTGNEIETAKSFKNSLCNSIAHERGEYWCKDKNKDYEDGQFTTNGQNIEDSVGYFLSDSTANMYKNCMPLASFKNLTEDDIFETTSFENDEFSIEVINCIGYSIINKININIIETALNDNCEKNVNPHIDHDQLLEWCNQKELSNSYRNGSVECNDEIVNLIDELISTERRYIIDLNYIIKEYLNYFRQHPIRAVFGNIEAILEHSQKFYTDLCSCKYDLQEIAATFLNYDVLFEIYVQHIHNHQRNVSYLRGTYETSIKDRTKALKDPFSMESRLLKLCQSLTRLSLWLQRIQKANEELGKTCETIGEAVLSLNSKLNRANTLVVIETIINCPFDLTKKGLFLLQDAFTAKRGLKTQVFLFEEVIVFTKVCENQKDSFRYIEFIAIDCVFPIPPTSNYYTITLDFKSPYGKREEIQIETHNEAIGKKWIIVINQLLMSQLAQAIVDRQKSF